MPRLNQHRARRDSPGRKKRKQLETGEEKRTREFRDTGVPAGFAIPPPRPTLPPLAKLKRCTYANNRQFLVERTFQPVIAPVDARVKRLIKFVPRSFPPACALNFIVAFQKSCRLYSLFDVDWLILSLSKMYVEVDRYPSEFY